MLDAFRFLTLMLSGLGLVLGGAHVLELQPKMAYEPALYATVTSTLYRLFGSVGAVIQVGAVIVAGVLTWLVRRHPSFRLTLFGCLGLVLSLALWGMLVAPVNAERLDVLKTAPESVPAAYARLRNRWEYGRDRSRDRAPHAAREWREKVMAEQRSVRRTNKRPAAAAPRRTGSATFPPLPSAGW
jgi:hypothetical protein